MLVVCLIGKRGSFGCIRLIGGLVRLDSFLLAFIRFYAVVCIIIACRCCPCCCTALSSGQWTLSISCQYHTHTHTHTYTHACARSPLTSTLCYSHIHTSRACLLCHYHHLLQRLLLHVYILSVFSWSWRRRRFRMITSEKATTHTSSWGLDRPIERV